MSSNETWAKLGGGVDIDAAHRKREGDTLHSVGEKPSAKNNPMGTPFADTSWETTVPNPLAGGQLFQMGDVVRHNATGKLYGILDTPDGMVVLERTGERAYCYRAIDGSDPRKWVRAQGEMEDGRFGMHRAAPTAR